MPTADETGGASATTGATFDDYNDKLRTAGLRADTLSELTQLMVEGQDPLVLAQRAVDLVARATDAAGAFVYLWDEQDQVLMLRVGTAGAQSPHVGSISLRLGEGVTGWSALAQQSVVLNRNIQQDPRFKSMPELQESKFNSMLAVPLVAPDGALLGVFSLYSYAEDAFMQESKMIAEEVGRLLASGLLYAETVEDLRRQSAAAHFLVQFPVNAATSVLHCARAAAQSVLRHMNSDGCVIEYFGRGTVTAPPIAMAVDRGEGNESLVRTTHSRASVSEFIETNFSGYEKISVSFGLTTTSGVVTCYRRRRYSTRELDRLSAICSQLAALFEAVEMESVGSSQAARLLRSVGRETFGRIVNELGWTAAPTLPVLVRVKRLRFDSDAVSRRVSPYLQEFAGARSLVLTDGPLSLLLLDLSQATPEELSLRLERTLKDFDEQHGVTALAGVGPVAQDVNSLQSGLAGAEAALAWAELVSATSGIRVTRFDRIRHLRELPAVGEDMGGKIKRELLELEVITQHDVENGTQLTETVAALLTNRGSIGETASMLHIHRNTLRQRVQRIEQLIGHPFEDFTDWLPTAIAARMAMRKSVRTGKTSQARDR